MDQTENKVKISLDTLISKYRFALVFFIIILTAILSSGITYYLVRGFSNSKLSPNTLNTISGKNKSILPITTVTIPAYNTLPPTSTLSPSPIITIDNSWLTYTNKQYNFSFKYPPTLFNPCPETNRVCMMSFKTAVAELEPIVMLKDELVTGESINGFGIFVTKNELTSGYNNFLENFKTEMINKKKEYEKINMEKIVGNETDTIFPMTEVLGNELKGYFVYGDRVIFAPFPGGKRAIIFIPSEIHNSFYDVFYKILSTFRFNNQT